MKLSAWKYEVPFTKPLHTAKGIIRKRRGLIVRIMSDTVTAFGEIAPLDGFSRETLPEVEKIIFGFRFDILRILASENPVQQMGTFFEVEGLPPSLEFGLDTLAHDFEARYKNTTLSHRLFGKSFSPVPVNALLSLQQTDSILKTVQYFIRDGYQTLKIKVGSNFESELETVEKIRDHFPSLRIRLDANQSWSTKQAVGNLQLLEQLDIEYCEEPLRNPSAEKYRQLKSATSIPLAVDESIHQLENWNNLLPYLSVIIIKPVVTGSFNKNFATIALADTHDIRTVVTTSLESGIGQMVTAAIASGLGSENYAHGLSSGFLSENDFGNEFYYIQKGFFHLTEAAGLGITGNPDASKFTVKLFEEVNGD